jgi:hypothetical protein
VEQETTTDEPATSYALKAKKLRKKAGAKEDKRFQRIAMTVTGLGTLAGAGLFAYLGTRLHYSVSKCRASLR